ncbi:MAG TPA: hypothetical protein VF773_04750 [Verrucomicrobiae bacterium]
MKATKTITASAALAALAMGWWKHHRTVVCSREAEFEQKCNQEALDTFEGEGGLVLA